jgi:hypothetical protein
MLGHYLPSPADLRQALRCLSFKVKRASAWSIGHSWSLIFWSVRQPLCSDPPREGQHQSASTAWATQSVPWMFLHPQDCLRTLSMAPVNDSVDDFVSEASASMAYLGSAIPGAVGESSLSGADLSALTAVFEYDSSGLLLDYPVFGFPGESLFPAPAIDAAVESATSFLSLRCLIDCVLTMVPVWSISLSMPALRGLQ